MTITPVTISVMHCSREQVFPEIADPVRDVGQLMRAYASASDVTVSITLPADHGTLLVALEAGNAFVGLQTPDGIYQYIADDACQGKRLFIIGGARTWIDARYVLPVTAAIELLTPWLAGSPPLAALEWRRQ